MPKNKEKTICFLHYGIGWKDGINVVLKTLTSQIQKQNPDLKICFLGGEIKQEILKGACYKKIRELVPTKRKLTKKYLGEKSNIIAKKIAEATKGIDVVVIENPFLGAYHLTAMKGFSLYASRYKPKGAKVFFRIHDLYADAPQYSKNLQGLFSPLEIKEILKGRGVDGFLVVNRHLKTILAEKGVPRKKIFYMPNGVDAAIFNKRLSKKEIQLLHKSFKLSVKDKKGAKFLVYPVRVVPRKNIEEAILLTYFIRELTKDNYVLVVSGKIDSHDPLSRDYYKGLRELVKVANFPVIFSKGRFVLKREYDSKGKIKKFSIGDLYKASQAVVMTSLREGFGYPFLECWFARRIIIGRRIKIVIRDFEKSGLKFQWLYNNFLIQGKDIPFSFKGGKIWLVPAIFFLSIFKKKDMEDLSKAKREEYLEGAKMIIDILKNDKLRNQVLKQNRGNIMKQVRILENKKRQQKIIEANFKTAKKAYETSKTTERFLKIVNLND